MIEQLRKTGLISNALLDGILRELDVPSTAHYRVLGTPTATVDDLRVLGIGIEGMTTIELLKFESAGERVNAGYAPAQNTLLLVNIVQAPPVTLEHNAGGDR